MPIQKNAVATSTPDEADTSRKLTLLQRLPTSGARTALPFRLEGELFLAVPQLAQDIPGAPAQMNGGDSDIDAVIYRWSNSRFEEHERLPTSGGEDVLVFEIEGTTFLATASIRTGHGPYDMNALSSIYRRQDGAWRLVQRVPTFAAKQWHHCTIGERHFLALAQGVTLPHATPRHPRESRILEWNGETFEDFQVLEGCWGYNWTSFECGGHQFLGYADHTSATLFYRWDGAAFVPFQTLAERGGRAFRFFEHEGAAWLALAVIDGESTLFRWDGAQFVAHQSLGGPGGREFELVRTADALHLVRVCFIEGTPAAPKTDLLSQIYRWRDGRFHLVEEFPTFGGTDVNAFEADGRRLLAVSNSLTADIRFRQDSFIYELAL